MLGSMYGILKYSVMNGETTSIPKKEISLQHFKESN